MISAHSQADMREANSKKRPAMIMDYNKSKGGVATVLQNALEYSCQRKTRRWSLRLFLNLLNIAKNNSNIFATRFGIQFTKVNYLKELTFGLDSAHNSANLKPVTLEATKKCGFILLPPKLLLPASAVVHSQSVCDGCLQPPTSSENIQNHKLCQQKKT